MGYGQPPDDNEQQQDAPPPWQPQEPRYDAPPPPPPMQEQYAPPMQQPYAPPPPIQQPYGQQPYGQQMYAPPPMQQQMGSAQGYDWTIALILSIFLGELGVDRFYTGSILLGILKLVTFGGCGVWYIIDIILIVTGAYKDAQGRPLVRKL